MHVYLNLGYHPEPGGAIGRELHEKIADAGFHGIRQDACEITGEERKRERLPAGKTTLRLPSTEWPHGCVLRLAAERSVS